MRDDVRLIRGNRVPHSERRSLRDFTIYHLY